MVLLREVPVVSVAGPVIVIEPLWPVVPTVMTWLLPEMPEKAAAVAAPTFKAFAELAPWIIRV